MKCWKCSATMPDDGRFCPVCGAENMAAPGVGEAGSETAAVVSESATGEVHREDEGNTEKKKSAAKPLLICAATVALVGAAAFFMKPPVKADVQIKNVFYAKDGGFYRADLSKAAVEPELLTGDFEGDEYDFYEIYGNGLLYYLYREYEFVSKDGTCVYYPEDMDTETLSYTLYCKEEGEEPVKIGNRVMAFEVLDNHQVVYQNYNKDLQLFDGERSKKLAKDVSRFQMDDAQKYLLFTTQNYDEDYTSTIYYQELTPDSEKVRIEGRGYLLSASDDFSRILYMKKNSLYLVEDFGKPKKLLEDADQVMSVNIPDLSFYYTKVPDGEKGLMDYVEDDMAAADALITEPDIADYQHQEETGTWWKYDKTVTDDEYYRLKNEYDKKVLRDELRASLEDASADYASELYYYADGESHLLDENFYYADYYSGNDLEAGRQGILVYDRRPESEKIKLSELSTTEDVYDYLYYGTEEDMTVCIARGDKTAEMGEVGIWSVREDEDMNRVYYLQLEGEVEEYAVDDPLYKLCYVSSAPENLGEVVEVDRDVVSMEDKAGSKLYYTKDCEEGVGDLYSDGQLVLSNVAVNTTRTLPESDTVVCISDPVSAKNHGTLTMIKDGTPQTIAEHASTCLLLDEKSLIVMTDFNDDKGRGDLNYYDGEKLIPIDIDVDGIFPERGKPTIVYYYY